MEAQLEGPMVRRNDVSVKIDAEVYRLVKTAAAWQGRDLGEYLSEIAREAALRDIAKMKEELPPQPSKKGRGSKSAE
jgi:hypothetical protein